MQIRIQKLSILTESRWEIHVVAYTYPPEGGDNYTLSQGYMGNVYDDKVEFKAREFSTCTWIKTVTIPIMVSNQQK